jgi:ATP-dependent Clp protease ATP-binding subunit ClpA
MATSKWSRYTCCWRWSSSRRALFREFCSDLGATPAAVSQEAAKVVESLPKVGGTTDHFISPALKEVFDQSFKETEQFKDEYVSTEHLAAGPGEEDQ